MAWLHCLVSFLFHADATCTCTFYAHVCMTECQSPVITFLFRLSLLLSLYMYRHIFVFHSPWCGWWWWCRRTNEQRAQPNQLYFTCFCFTNAPMRDTKPNRTNEHKNNSNNNKNWTNKRRLEPLPNEQHNKRSLTHTHTHTTHQIMWIFKTKVLAKSEKHAVMNV